MYMINSTLSLHFVVGIIEIPTYTEDGDQAGE
jgi:hypothetical protein